MKAAMIARLIPVIVVAFVLPFSAQASVVASQSTKNTAGSYIGPSVSQTLGQMNVSDGNYLQSVTVSWQWDGIGSITNTRADFFCYSDSGYSAQVDCGGGTVSGTMQATSSLLLTSSASQADYTYTFNTTGGNVVIFDDSLYYVLVIRKESSGGGDIRLYGSASNNYANGLCETDCSSVADYYFIINDNYTSSTNNSDDTRIEWVTPPVQTPVYGTESNEFDIRFRYYLNSANSDAATFTKILIQLYPLNYPNDPPQRITAVASTTYNSLQDVTVSVATPRNGYYLGVISAWNGVSEPVTCNWWEIFCEDESVIVGISASNKFNVATNSIAADVAPIFLPPEQAAQYCLNNNGAISIALCQTAVALFVPSTESMTAFNSSAELLKTKFPFSWFYGVTTVIGNINPNSNTATATPSVQINFANAAIGSSTPMAGILPNVVLFGTSTISHYFPSSVAQPFKYLITITLYMGLAYAAYKTIPRLFNGNNV